MQTVSRLLDSFIPKSYRLNITIDRPGRCFSGTVTISGNSVNGQIIVHAHELEITGAVIDGKSANYSLGVNDEVHISQENLEPGAHMVTIAYQGKITDSLHGLYPCYFTHEGLKKELLITQFESHYAREMFPCIDEPAAKAIFDVTVTTESGVMVLSNMPPKEQTENDGKLTTTFDTTPKMSTYLLAFVIGELQSKSSETKSGVKVNVWATPAQEPTSLEYALEEAVKLTEFFDEYFGVPYPLPKADHVAVPDFGAGAMENWGLITYRETALLAQKDHSSLVSRQYVTSVVAHELSHQWFGNLVTMKWWNNLWLNESFASIMENLAPDRLHPTWKTWLDFDAGGSVMALRRDAIDGVQSVQIDVNHPDEIQSIFDGAIVYSKGARLLRMMKHYVGDEAFRAGLTRYFTEHAYGNTDQHDLWRAMADASGKDIDSLMTTWISQPGYPVVAATLKDGLLTLSQRQFFVGSHQVSCRVWPIPLGASNDQVPALLESPSVTIPFDESWLFLNRDNTAHFITHYDDGLFAALLKRLAEGELRTSERLQILNEQILLARGQVISPARLVDTLEAYAGEDQEPVWDVMSMAVNELKKYIEHDASAEAALRQLVGRLARPLYEKLGWDQKEGEPDNDRKLRGKILGEMVYSEDKAVIEEAIRRAREKPIEQLDPESRGLLLSADVRYGDNNTLIDELMKRYAKEVSPDIKEDIRSAVTCVRDDGAIKRVIGMLTDTTIIRPQDNAYWYIYLQSNRNAREQTWQWLREHWDWIETKFGTDKSYDYYPRYAGQLLMTRQQFEEYKTFFTPMLSNIALTRVIEMGMTDLEGRVALIEAQQLAVCERLLNFDALSHHRGVATSGNSDEA